MQQSSAANRRRSSSMNRQNSIKSLQNFKPSKPLTKPEWDATVSDLNQLKATKEELNRRKVSLKSKNADLVKFEKQKQEILKSAKKTNQSGKLNNKSQLALLKEILYDDQQLKCLLQKSDSTLKLVKHLFDDNNDEEDTRSICSTNMKPAKINLTLAPNVTNLNNSNLPHDVMVNNVKEAANLHNANVKYPNENVQMSTAGSSSSKLENLQEISKLSEDLEKYKKLLTLKEALSADESRDWLNEVNLKDIEECLKLIKIRKESQEKQQQQQQQSRSEPPAPASMILNESQNFNLNDELKKALFELQSKFNDFERHLGKKLSNDVFLTQMKSYGAFSSSYNLTLVKLMSNLLDHLKETSVELNYEKLKQVELNKQLDLHRKLIDGLTTEILCVKEQNEKIINEHINQNAKIETELEQIKLYLTSNQMSMSAPLPPPPLIDRKLKQSAFIYKPIALQQNQLHHKSIDATTTSNKTNDIFSERLNTMLHSDKSASLGQFGHHQQTAMTSSSSDQQQQNYFLNQNRPFSASSLHTIQYQQPWQNANDMAHYTKTSMSPVNAGGQQLSSQINELKIKNAQTEQRLKQLQAEQKQANHHHQPMVSTKQSTSQQSLNELQNNELKQKREALDKLKQEQRLLKEQISQLNLERQTANQELEVLSLHSLSHNDFADSNSDTTSNKNQHNNNNHQTSNEKFMREHIIQQLKEFSHDLASHSPSLSPISLSNKNMPRDVNKKQ